MADQLAGILDRIRLLDAIDRDRQVFGASDHGYELAAPLTEPEVVALEASLGALPDEYRRFLRTAGAHGCGPYYGLRVPEAPDPAAAPARAFRCERAAAHDAPVPAREHLLDGTIVLAEQGCGGRSLLVVSGGRRGEVWSDSTREHGTLEPEAPSFLAWYQQWSERALLEWIERAAPRIAMDGPDDPSELEAVAVGFELLIARARGDAAMSRTLGYLHLRERRWSDADAAFAAAAACHGDEPAARLALDRARLATVRGDAVAAVKIAREGLASEQLWYSTRDELRDVLERGYAETGRADDALAVLDARAADCFFSLVPHHRLARERLARHDVGGAGAALERASRMERILGSPQDIDTRVPASFDPIIGELRAAGRHVDAEALAARASIILDAN